MAWFAVQTSLMPRPLDRVVWNALNGLHAKFAEGGALARRYRPLATLAEPGPFTLKAQVLGTFYGIHIGNGPARRLAAMTGERMKPEGFGEVSGVCTHPDFRGHGPARVLSVFVTRKILARGETPFLHAWTENDAAIRLYEQVGFAVRAELRLLAATKPA